jgi:hypothetical protein
MRADNSRFLLEAAHRRRRETADKVARALRRLQREGEEVTFQSVAHAAGVSRNWLYRTEEVRQEIERLRKEGSRRTAVKVPRTQRASARSKDALLELLRAKQVELLNKNQELNRQLAEGHGRIRELSRSTSHP